MADETTPPGWYPHPSMASTLGYWDGERWTDQVAPSGQAAVGAPPAAAEPANPILIGLGYLLALVLPIGGLVVAAVLYRRSQTNAILIAVFSVLAAFVYYDVVIQDALG